MNSIISHKAMSFVKNPAINVAEENTEKELIHPIAMPDKSDISVISEESKINYGFLSRIQGSISSENNNLSPDFIKKYNSEYTKIKKEIADGFYGRDVKKISDLLDSAFNDAVNNALSYFKEGTATNIVSSDLLNGKKTCPLSKVNIACHKQVEQASGLILMLKAEQKQIMKDIIKYKKEKNYQMVASLTELSNNYKHIITNLSGTVDLVQNSTDDSIKLNSTQSINSSEE